MPKLQIRRVILFARNLEALTAFYRDVLGLEVRGGSVALHRGKSKPGTTKITFRSGDVRKTRDELVGRGATFGKVKDFGELVLCDGRDPEGNLIQLSSRP